MKMKKSAPEWFIGVVITLFFLFTVITGIFDFTHQIELKIFNLSAELVSPGERDSAIELVIISEDDFAEIGQFPWPRDILAEAIDNLSFAGARVIAPNILLTKPEESLGLKTVRECWRNSIWKLRKRRSGLILRTFSQNTS